MSSSSCSSTVDASQVGLQFVKEYYEVIQHQPELISHRFYTGSSTMIRVDGVSTQTASAISEIQKLVDALQFSWIEIKTINSVESSSVGITVVVSGSIKSNCFTGWRKFVETFFLAPQENKGYMVINDIFHFVTDKDLSGVVYTKHFSEIFHITQKNHESVEDFTFRFTKETMQFPEASDDLKIVAFIQGVHNDELIKRLHCYMPKTFENLIHQVKVFAQAERIIALNKEAGIQKSTRPKKRKRKRKKFSSRQAQPNKSCMEQTITFPAIRTNDFQEGPLLITATMPGHRVGLRVQHGRNVHWREIIDQA